MNFNKALFFKKTDPQENGSDSISQEEIQKKDVADKASEKMNDIKLSIMNLDFYYGKFHALHKISLDIEVNRVTAFYWSFWMRKIHPFEMFQPDL